MLWHGSPAPLQRGRADITTQQLHGAATDAGPRASSNAHLLCKPMHAETPLGPPPNLPTSPRTCASCVGARGCRHHVRSPLPVQPRQGTAQAFPLPASPFQFHCPDNKGCNSSPLNPLLARERGSRSSPVATRALWVRARAATHRTRLGQRGPLQFAGFQSELGLFFCMAADFGERSSQPGVKKPARRLPRESPQTAEAARRCRGRMGKQIPPGSSPKPTGRELPREPVMMPRHPQAALFGNFAWAAPAVPHCSPPALPLTMETRCPAPIFGPQSPFQKIPPLLAAFSGTGVCPLPLFQM